MKNALIIIFLTLSISVSATTYYVSTSGSDSNNGLSTSSPWATLSWAESHATAAGDIIALKKGDTWSLATSVVIKHGGTTGSPITWDGSLWGSGANGKILNTKDRGDGNNALVHFITSGSHDVVFKNIIADGGNHQCFGIVIGYHSAISGNAQNNEHDITIDGCSILNIGSGAAYNQGFLCGTWYTDIWNITIQNCTLDGADDEQLTFYGGRTDEWDAQARECRNVVIRNNTLTNWGRRGQSTGYGMQINNKATNVLIEGNTLTQGASGKGDAFHLESNEPIAGYYPTGVIFRYNKLTVNRTNEWCVIVQKGQAMTMTAYSNIFIHTSSSNTSGGNIWIISNGTYTGAKLNFYNNTFYTRTGRSYEDDSHLTGVCTFKNNIIYHAGTLSTDNPVIISSAGSTVHSNNLYYRVGTGDVFLVSEGGSSKYQSTITSWEPTAKKDDPLFTDVSGNEFTLKSGSCAIGSGVVISTVVSDMGSNLYANPPSMGAFESSTTSTSPVIPVYVSSVIQAATPTNLEMTYNLSLANIVPAASAFRVTVNSVVQTVSTVAVSGTKVTLTLSTPVVNGDVVTVSYTKPSANPLQTTAGGEADNITSKPVTNNVSAVVIQPVYVSSVIQNATPSNLEMTYNLSLANIVPAASAFRVTVNSVVRTVSTVAVSGTKVTLTLSTPVVNGDVVTVSYTKPSANPLQTTAGGEADNITSKPVTNNVSAVVIQPVYVSSVIQNATPSNLEMTYNLSLANIVPAASAFRVTVNSVVRTVSTVAVSGTKVTLTLSTPVVNGDVVTVSYTKPSTNPLQTTAGGEADNITSKPVTNNVSAVVIQPVYVSSVIQNATPSNLEMTYNLSLANIVPAASAFRVTVNSVVRTVSTVAVSGTKVTLTLSTPVVNGDVVTVSYTKPSANPLQTTTGGEADNITSKPVTNNVSAVVIQPVYVSSVIQNATPSNLEMTYNLSLANIVPAASAFRVTVNSVVRTVSTVAVSGTKVTLTLSTPVVNGDVVTVSYTKPSTNPLQTTAGGEADNITSKPVTNNVSAVVIQPVYVSSVIQNATPSNLEMTYNLSLANIVPAASAFRVTVNSVVRTVSTVAVSGTKVTLTLSTPVVNGDVVTVSYTKPSANPLQTTTGGEADNITSKPVTNNVSAVVIQPVYVSSVIQNATPSNLEMTYNLSLANIVPAASAFRVTVNSVVRTVSTVAVSGTKVTLTLSTPVVFGDKVTVSYTRPSINPLQGSSSGVVVNISNQPVSNNCINAAPVAVITSPASNSSFTPGANITITASATDSDGSISTVEFYSNDNKIGTKTAAPYSFTWSNVGAGTYILTVVATDNYNATTRSSAVIINVASVNPAPNQPPFIQISNPRKGNKYEEFASVTIDAIASDPDGSISKVEFYNGIEKLIELNSEPYTYTWKNVGPGSYSITAVATDNLNASTVSTPIEFEVGSIVKYDAGSEIINLYPNPSDGHFSIEFINPLQSEKSEILITDIAGKQVYHGPVLKEEITKQLDLSNSKSGIYVLMIKDKDILVTKKFIIK